MQSEQFLPVTVEAHPINGRVYAACKRTMDLVLVALFLAIGAPVMILIAVLVKLDSPGPVLFKQSRLGRGGRPFTFYKFRTMYHNADSEIHRRYVQAFIQNQLQDDRGAQASAPIFKLTHDTRITRVGSVLRRVSLDELPQLFNVLIGDMSLVGPRPPLPYEFEQYQEWHKGRLAVLPGITGWWQVWGRSRVQFDEMVHMDMRYIAQQSLWLDIKILALTIPAVISGKGAE